MLIFYDDMVDRVYLRKNGTKSCVFIYDMASLINYNAKFVFLLYDMAYLSNNGALVCFYCMIWHNINYNT